MIRPAPAVLLVALLLLAPAAAGQLGAGTLFQSIDDVQLAGAGNITLPGQSSVTKTEIIGWSMSDGASGARVMFSFEGITTMFGDLDGDGLPFDLDDIDALEVGTYAQGSSPTLYDFRFSLANTVVSGGVPVITPGDVVQLTGIGSWVKTVPESAFQAAVGTGQSLNVDAYCELPGGAVLVSFEGPGSGTNIVNPLFGGVGFYQWSGADVFLLRPPVGAFPAILAYRQSELAGVVSAWYPTYTLTEIVGVETQPFTNPITNPNDPTGLYQGGTRPHVLWTVQGDENVFCGSASANPVGNHNLFGIVSGSQGAGYGNATPQNRVFADALALGEHPLPPTSRINLDVASPIVAVGNSVTFTVRSPRPAGTFFQIAVTPRLAVGLGVQLPGFGFGSLVLRVTEPLLYLSLVPPLSTLLTTSAADAFGTASTIALPVAGTLSMQDLRFQAFDLGTGALSAPLTVHVN